MQITTAFTITIMLSYMIGRKSRTWQMHFTNNQKPIKKEYGAVVNKQE